MLTDTTIVPPSFPFHWNGKEYKIEDVGIKNNKAIARVKPHNSKLVKELKRRIKKDLGLVIYLGNGFVCFVEDYPKIAAQKSIPRRAK